MRCSVNRKEFFSKKMEAKCPSLSHIQTLINDMTDIIDWASRNAERTSIAPSSYIFLLGRKIRYFYWQFHLIPVTYTTIFLSFCLFVFLSFYHSFQNLNHQFYEYFEIVFLWGHHQSFRCLILARWLILLLKKTVS